MKKNLALTEETVGDDPPGKLWRMALLAVAVLAIANVVAGLVVDTPGVNRGYWLVRQKWRMLLDRREPVDWLVLGDSACNQGVRPDVLETALGGKALNLCTIGNMLAVNDAWMLDAYLERHDPPKGVVIVHVYDVWHRGAGYTGPVLLGEVPLPWGFWGRYEPRLSFDAGQKWLFFASRYLPLYADNQSLGNWIRSGSIFRSSPYSIDERGFMAVDAPNAEEVDADTKEHLTFVRENKFAMSEDNERAIEHVAELAEARGFDVYLAESPMHDALAHDHDFAAYHAEYRRKIREYTSRFPRFHHALTYPVPFPRAVLENSDHLVKDAPKQYTETLVRAIKAAKERQL